tara:strand:+ start:1032 stop:2804 length:1773 start_codon:yes stop_codon:yes gene_type:complete
MELSFKIPNDQQQCQELLKMVDEDWLQKRQNWTFLGQLLHNILKEQGLILFERYTPEEFKNDCNEVFENFTKTVHGLKAFKTMTKRMNVQLFSKWQRQVIKAAALGAIDELAARTEIADISRFMFDFEFVCTDVKRQRWMHFNGGKWEVLSGGHSMKQKFSRELEPIFKRIYKNMETLEEDQKLIQMKKKCAQIIRDLKEPGQKETLLKECSEIFFVQDFEKDCDEQPMLTNFKNGIYDFEKMIFRPGYPEDMMTLQMNANYPENCTWEDEGVKYIQEFYRKILIDEDKRDYCLGMKAEYLTGGNDRKELVMHIGPTAHNGKTTSNDFDLFTFGSYADKLPSSVLTGKDVANGGANPALAGTKATRLQQIDETRKDQDFNASFMKVATGNDKIWARPLYSNGFSFTPQFTVIIIGNDAPSAKKCVGDAGAVTRWVWLNYDSRFVRNAPETEEEQWAKRIFPADPHIKFKLQKYPDEYVWLLVEIKKKTNKHGIKVPADVIKKTEEYRYKSDPYLQFKDQCLIQSKNARIEVKELYNEFKIWYSASFPGAKLDDRTIFDQEIERVLGDPAGSAGMYFGYKIKGEIKRTYEQ